MSRHHWPAVLLLLGLTACTAKPLFHKRGTGRPLTNQEVYWQALTGLDWETMAVLPVSGDNAALEGALRLIRDGEMDAAVAALRRLRREAADAGVFHQAQTLLFHLLFLAGNWQELSTLGEEDMAGQDQQTFIGAFRHIPPAAVSLAEEPFAWPLKIIRGCPVIRVSINGGDEMFLLDSGTSLSVVASDVADRNGVRILESSRSRANTATGRKVDFRPALVEDLRIGPLQWRNLPAVVVRKKDLRAKYRLLKLRLIEELDGIIGWDCLHRLRTTIDMRRHTVTFSPAAAQAAAERNFFWLGYPIVRAQTHHGHDLYWGLDTGALRSSLTQNVLAQTATTTFRRERRSVYSVGGIVKRYFPIVTLFPLRVSGYDFAIREAVVFERFLAAGSFRLAGRLGCDLLRSGTVTFDMKAGLFSFHPYANKTASNDRPHP